MEKFETRILVIVLTLLFLLMGLFVLVFFLVYRKNQNAKENQIEKMNNEFLQTQLEIQEQTLRTISQEIHDNVGQVLSLAKLNLNTLDIDNGVDKELKIDSSIQLVGKAINDLRDLSRSLNGDKIADLGLRDAIDNELKIIQNTGQFATRLSVTGEPYTLLPHNEIVLFRIVQESLNNTIKHSKAKNISVDIKYTGTRFTMAVHDDGSGFDAALLEATKTGIGLHNMQSRALLIGAFFSIESVIDKGTTVQIELPYLTT